MPEDISSGYRSQGKSLLPKNPNSQVKTKNSRIKLRGNIRRRERPKDKRE
jgi:hypothetical protein